MASWSVAGNLLVDGQLSPGVIDIVDGRIGAVHRERQRDMAPALEAAIVAPGLIDLQVNGGFGVEVGANPDAIRHLARCLPETGVTSFLPTVITGPAADYALAFAAFASAKYAPGARPLGLHLEGPYLSHRRKGAHRSDLIDAANDALFESLLDGEGLRLMTLAPERPLAGDRIRRLRDRGVLVSLGHTDATYEEFVASVDLGAAMATHLYNAMSPFGHRAPGSVGAALADDRVTVGLIADGAHSHPASLRLAFKAKGADRIALVSDMMPATGMPPGIYEFGGQKVRVDGTTAKLDDGTLAGSVVTLDQMVRNLVRWTGATTVEALRMASEVPARLLGLTDFGRIVPGAVADLVMFDSDLQVQATIVDGEVVYQRESA